MSEPTLGLRFAPPPEPPVPPVIPPAYTAITLEDYVVTHPAPTAPQPDEDTLIAWLADEEEPEAIDGCEGVEPDGACPHGRPSWLRYLGLV